MDEHRVYISHIKSLKEDIITSLEFIKWKKYVKSDSTVFIKPNFTYPFYKKGITTSPHFLKILLGILKDRADNVILGESNGGNNSFTADDSFKGHHMPEICKSTGVELVNLSKLPSRFVKDDIQGKKVKVQLPNLLLDDIDCMIPVPVLKVHVMTNVTLSIKNLWGCYPDTMRCLHHQNLNEKLTLINKVLKPSIVVLDGTYALDGHGPMYGDPKKIDLIMSSNNSVAIDSIGTRVMGIPLEKALHILTAEKEGLGTTNLNNIILNKDWENYQMHFDVNKTLVDNLSTLLFKSETIAKIVMDSPITPVIYSMARFLRNSNEKEVVEEIQRYCQ